MVAATVYVVSWILIAVVGSFSIHEVMKVQRWSLAVIIKTAVFYFLVLGGIGSPLVISGAYIWHHQHQSFLLLVPIIFGGSVIVITRRLVQKGEELLSQQTTKRPLAKGTKTLTETKAAAVRGMLMAGVMMLVLSGVCVYGGFHGHYDPNKEYEITEYINGQRGSTKIQRGDTLNNAIFLPAVVFGILGIVLLVKAAQERD